LSVNKELAVAQSSPKLHKSSNFIFKCFKLFAMNSKSLLVALSVVAFSSCSTAYKTGQTPDDVYYSPTKIIEKDTRSERQEQVKIVRRDDYEINMGIRDYRWRDFSDDYRYDYSPYYYATYNTYNYGYYYNPYYYPWAIYTGKITYSPPVNSTPRMVNLNAYNGYNTRVATGKTTGTLSWSNPSTQYNNSNRSSSNRNESRQVIEPRNNNTRSFENNTRTYTPSSSNSSSPSSSGSSSSGSSSSGTRPGRGG
jgi:hypothetical protein